MNDGGLSRRQFLRVTGTAGLLATSGSWPAFGAVPASGTFRHGVASGDPLPDRVVLWSRISPEPGLDLEPEWQLEVALDPELSDVVARRQGATSAERDFTVKVDVELPEPDRGYFYRFSARGGSSPIGRTRTAPLGTCEHLRFAVCSCARYEQGYFGGYRDMARRADLDAVIHLGDYIYDLPGGPGDLPGRELDPEHEIWTLEHYRRRYALYRSDPDLQELHRQHPMIAVWDDHEIAGDAWRGGAVRHDPARHGDWSERRRSAVRAYHEWLPIRTPDLARPERIYRRFSFGDLVELFMIDTRLIGRDRQAGDISQGRPAEPEVVLDPKRSILGEEQRRWLLGGLEGSTAGWRLLGNQVPLAPIVLFPNDPQRERGYLGDKWDGYRADQERLLAALGEAREVVVLTGDMHSSWAFELTGAPQDPELYDPASGRGAVGVELVCPSIAARPPQALVASTPILRANNPHLKYLNTTDRGFLLIDVSPERVQADWVFTPDLGDRNDRVTEGAHWRVGRGSSRLEQAASAATAKPAAAPLAPRG